MAHTVFHFAVGMAVGTAILLPAVYRRLKNNEATANPIRNWLIAAYGLGAWAVLPGALKRLGVADGWWMNVFLLHPLINRMKGGGVLVGEILLVFFFVLQYVTILVALRRRLNSGAGTPSS
jgi:hypothetical protein